MSKSLDAKELQEAAEAVFKQYPKENVLYVASDGNVFLDANKGDAFNYSRENELQLNRIDRPGTEPENFAAQIKAALVAAVSGKAAGELEEDTDFRGQSIDLSKATGEEVVNAILTETKLLADNKALQPNDPDDVPGDQEETIVAPAGAEQITGQAEVQVEQVILPPVAEVQGEQVSLPPVEQVKPATSKSRNKTSTKPETV